MTDGGIEWCQVQRSAQVSGGFAAGLPEFAAGDVQMLFGFARDATTHKLLGRWIAPLGTVGPTTFPPGPEWGHVADDEAQR